MRESQWFNTNAQQKLKEGLESLEIIYSTAQYEQLKIYTLALEELNQHSNFVKAEGSEFVENHLLDCLSPLRYFQENDLSSLADIGTGVGLPGIPLAIFMPETRVFLVERMKKRCDFLRYIITKLQLSQRVEIVESDLKSVKNKVHALTCRAFHPLDKSYWRSLENVMSAEGTSFFYKGKLSLIKSEFQFLCDDYDVKINPLVTFSAVEPERHLVCVTRK